MSVCVKTRTAMLSVYTENKQKTDNEGAFQRGLPTFSSLGYEMLATAQATRKRNSCWN